MVYGSNSREFHCTKIQQPLRFLQLIFEKPIKSSHMDRQLFLLFPYEQHFPTEIGVRKWAIGHPGIILPGCVLWDNEQEVVVLGNFLQRVKVVGGDDNIGNKVATSAGF